MGDLAQNPGGTLPPALPISLFPRPKLFPGSLEEMSLCQEPPGRAQATWEQPPPLPPKMCRSVSVTNLRPSLLKPFQEGPSGRPLSQENLLTETDAHMVSHSTSLEQLSLLGSVLGTLGNETDSLCPPGIPMGMMNTSKIAFETRKCYQGAKCGEGGLV